MASKITLLVLFLLNPTSSMFLGVDLKLELTNFFPFYSFKIWISFSFSFFFSLMLSTSTVLRFHVSLFA